jgi:regulator of replication initiation timing
MFSQLNDRVSSSEEQICQLKEIVARLKEQNDRLEKENDRVSSLEEDIFQLKEIVAGLKEQNDRLKKENADIKPTVHGNVLIGYFCPRDAYCEIPFFINKNANYEDFKAKMRYVAGKCSEFGFYVDSIRELPNITQIDLGFFDPTSQFPIRYHHSLTGLIGSKNNHFGMICSQPWPQASVDQKREILKIFQECKIDLLYNGEHIKL